MTADEHLDRIVARCNALLALAEKRTPGKWDAVSPLQHIANEPSTHSVEGPPSDFMFLRNKDDAAFIASAAGPFEASLRSTIAAIEGLRYLASYSEQAEECGCYNYAGKKLAAICAAWPEKLL